METEILENPFRLFNLTVKLHISDIVWQKRGKTAKTRGSKVSFYAD